MGIGRQTAAQTMDGRYKVVRDTNGGSCVGAPISRHRNQTQRALVRPERLRRLPVFFLPKDELCRRARLPH
jgi:hypothetical protein